MRKIKVKQADEGSRIDLFLKNELNIPRSQAKKLLNSELVTINGKTAKPRTQVFAGAIVQLSEEQISALEKPEQKKQPVPELDILYEDDDVLVINKQAGVLVHPAQGAAAPTITSALVARYPDISLWAEDINRPGIVHRLDKDVSGVMIIAKTEAAFSHLKKQFHDRKVTKEYIALVHGNLPKEKDTIKLVIARSREKARMVARPQSQDGKQAITHYRVIDRFRNYDLARVQIETGRTHQIRAHFHALGHPVAGDPLYRIKSIKSIDLNRIFLHADKLSITLPSGKKQTFESELPEELQTILTKLPKV